ncbi:hypothetical protein SAMN04487948_11017 [Halogranum amylolyticum]|uniref:DoxX-like family protein n=1 Tax=Halogranum amylolyticum TaxID=660520 RepID=A0A1H8U9S0_9EURY|nr:hypothetical protein [Halogranum amylolyticum]SEO99594.1 hypothetical protein SAMN04487948_11017 [Halogranum amylolyticum]
MLRKILTTIGIVELLAPEALIETAEQVALEDPDECELRSWVVTGARVEGLALLLLMWGSDASYSRFKKFLGLIGILALSSPHVFVGCATPLAYTDASNCNWKPWVYEGTRLVGVLYVLIALNELRHDWLSDSN